MGRRSSLTEDVVRVKNLMGLKPFKDNFFFEKKNTKIDLAPREVIINRSKVVYTLSMMYLTISLKDFFVKSPMGTPLY